MREIIVRYTLTDEEENRLEKIAEEYKRKDWSYLPISNSR